MEDKSAQLFLNSLIGGVYKILPMNENNDETLHEYIESVYIQLVGGYENFPNLKDSKNYISVLNVIQYFRNNKVDNKTCRREVLKCTNLLAKLSKIDEEVAIND